MFDEINRHQVDHAPDGFVDQSAPGQPRVGALHDLPVAEKDRHRIELFEGDQTRAQAVIDIVVVVGDFVGQVGKLGFEGGLVTLKETASDFAESFGVLVRAMLENAFPRFVQEIESVELGIAFFKHVDRAQRLQIVLEAAEILHAGVERLLPRVAKGRVTEIVGKGHGFGKVFVEMQRAGDRAGDLGHLDAVGQPRAKQVAFMIDENLGLVFKPPEGRAMHDAVAVALEFAARQRRRLGDLPASGVGFADRVGRQFGHELSSTLRYWRGCRRLRPRK